MLTVDEALQAILEEIDPFPPVLLPLGEALGLTLAEDAVSDIDSPPFDKALMDGFAVHAADMADGVAEFELLEEVTAGRVPTLPVERGQATQIMTGAPMPEGADAVVRVEDSTILETTTGRHVRLTGEGIRPGTNRLPRGTAMRIGECVAAAGRQLTPQALGAIAEAGGAHVSVRPRPRVALISTGDELVTIDQRPEVGQIRNSSDTMLCAQITRAGGVPVSLGIARDERPDLAAKIAEGLKCDLLLLSGGVSAGKLDLVPSELETAGVHKIFHKVRVKPGKPLWFGAFAGPGTCRVFGLPGNPVSSMVCFELFVRTAIRRMLGTTPETPRVEQAVLTADYSSRGDRTVYFPAKLGWDNSQQHVTPLKWHGSADLRSTADADAMLQIPAGNITLRAGDVVDVIRWSVD